MASKSHSASSSAALVFDAVFLSELFYSAGGVDEFLFAGKERVAIRANFHMDIAHRGTGFDHMATGTSDRRRLIFRMDTCLHKFLSNMKFYNITMGSLQTHAWRGEILDLAILSVFAQALLLYHVVPMTMKMIQATIWAALLAAALTAQGCPSGQLISQQTVEEKVARVALGQTTMAEVEATFGSPYLKEKQLWVYNLSDTEPGFKEVNAPYSVGAGLIPPIPTTVATNTRALITLRFNDAGTVKALEVARYFSSPYTHDYWYLVKESSVNNLEFLARIGESSGFKVAAVDFVSHTLNLEDTGSKARMAVTLDNQTLHITSTNPYSRVSNEYRIFVKRESAFTDAVTRSEVVQ